MSGPNDRMRIGMSFEGSDGVQMTVTNIRRTRGAASCSVGPVAITLFQQAPTGEEARNTLQILGDVARFHDQMMMLAIIAADCGIPDPPVRDALTREVKRFQKHLAKVANVVEGGGFAAAALRGAVTGMTLFL